MDTLTHALSGALLARATARAGSAPLPDLRERTLVGALAAAFPDCDYAISWIDPLTYLNLHRGLTHSLVLLPVWTLLLAALVALVRRGDRRWWHYLGVVALGLGIHIAGDVITSYGTRVFAPLSDARIALPATFIIDPWFTAIIVAGLIASTLRAPQAPARAALALLLLYVAAQGVLHERAEAIGIAHADAAGLVGAEVHALPQPFSPMNWKIVVAHEDMYRVAYASLWKQKATQPPATEASWWAQVWGLYRPATDLHWLELQRFGAADQQTVREAWSNPGFAAFRRFAVLPVVYRFDADGKSGCVWFTDLRFVVGAMIPPFRYGMCRDGTDDEWRLDQLRPHWGWDPSHRA